MKEEIVEVVEKNFLYSVNNNKKKRKKKKKGEIKEDLDDEDEKEVIVEKQQQNQKPKKPKKECVTKILEIDKGNKIVSAMMDGQLLIWDINHKELSYSIKAHESAIWAMIKLSDDKVVTGSSDKLIKVWDILNEYSDPIMVLKL